MSNALTRHCIVDGCPERAAMKTLSKSSAKLTLTMCRDHAQVWDDLYGPYHWKPIVLAVEVRA